MLNGASAGHRKYLCGDCYTTLPATGSISAGLDGIRGDCLSLVLAFESTLRGSLALDRRVLLSSTPLEEGGRWGDLTVTLRLSWCGPFRGLRDKYSLLLEAAGKPTTHLNLSYFPSFASPSFALYISI